LEFQARFEFEIKEEVTQQIQAKVVEVTKYPTWLTNIVLVPKKDGKIRICGDYKDLNKAVPMTNSYYRISTFSSTTVLSMKCNHLWIALRVIIRF